ncbi:MAG: DUF1045 domain-containing protein [Azospirillaceae bacterium]|nr:DUF1045 domain-containing protein [Azospirillaceae bacterium]
MNSARYALYFAPEPDTALARFGAWWFGRREDSPHFEALSDLADLAPERRAALVADARGYGLHATLKAPFRLREGCTVDELAGALAAFVAGRAAIAAAPLVLAEIDGFVALMPREPVPAITALAADCVAAFDRFRAPAAATELARRRSAGLTAAQDAYLLAWGYPYVMDEFRFHVTLTGRLDPVERQHIAGRLRPLLAPVLAAPLRLGSVCLFCQADATQPFVMRNRAALE